MRLAALLLACTAAGIAADPGAQQFFEQVRGKVLDKARRVPRYTCVQTIDRNQYHQRRNLDSTGYLIWRDRLRLDVAVLNGRETFAWAGARQFETTDIEQRTSSGSSGAATSLLFCPASLAWRRPGFHFSAKRKAQPDFQPRLDSTCPSTRATTFTAAMAGESTE